MKADASLSVFRPAGPGAAGPLTDLEREASLLALAHVFPGTPYPTAEIYARWERVLADPDVRVEIAGPERRPHAFVCWDPDVVRHLAVRPERWGSGLARAAVERAEADRLWCLVENHRARGFYEHVGWRATGSVRDAEWPPFPQEMEYAR
jgi:GNAT superfamily N-acetyltransferase